MRHPERAEDNGLEATVGEHLRLAEFLKGLDRLGEAELRQISRQMAYQVLMVHPAAMRFLAREAAKNLSGVPWSAEASATLIEALTKSEVGRE